MSESINGPWIMPHDDVFDGRAYYAAKSFSDGKSRYLFGWIPTKADDNDNGRWMWGGNLAVHEIIQRHDGTLGCKLPESIANAWNAQEIVDMIILKRWDGKGQKLTFANAPSVFKLETNITFKKGTKQFGIALGQSYETGHGYKYEFFPHENALKFNSITSVINTKDVCRTMQISEGDKINVKLIREDDVCVMYVNDEIALSARMCNIKGDDISVFVAGGEAIFENTGLSTLK